MSQNHVPLTRESVGNEFIGAYRELLPHAVHNVFMPFETPLRWFEAKYVGIPDPQSLSLWARLDDQKIDLTHNFNPQEPHQRALWSLGIADYSSFDETSQYTHTSLVIPLKGAVEVSFVTYKAENPSETDFCVKGEWNYINMGQDRRREIVGNALGT